MTESNRYLPQGTRNHGTETYRYALDARHAYDEGRCSVLVRRKRGVIELLFHCDMATGAILTAEQAHALAEALIDAGGDAS